MKTFFRHLIFGKREFNVKLEKTALAKQKDLLRTVWINEKHNDVGLEKLLRLFLISVMFIFPGLYIRDFFGRKGLTWKVISMELYVVFKALLPLYFLFSELHHYKLCVGISVYFLTETCLYIASLIFVDDEFAMTRSYRRSVLLLFLNYIEIVFDFAVIYAGFDLLKGYAVSAIDHIYFSFITSATIGYGDIRPINDLGKMVASGQTILFLVFVVLFLNFFSSKVKH